MRRVAVCAAADWFSMTRHGLLAAALLYPSLAAAQADPEAAAEALFRSGRKAAAAGDHEQACQRFRESQRLQPATGTVLNLAICEEQLGHLVQAWQHYHAVLDSLPEGDARRDIARGKLSNLDGRLPRFIIKKAARVPPRTRVKLGRVTLGDDSVGVPIPIDPGSHEWVVSAPGHRDRVYTREVAEGERLTLTVAPGAPVYSPRSRRTQPAARPDSTRQLLGYALIGVGAAGLAVSGVTALMALDRGRTVDDACNGRDCTPEGLRAADQGKTLVKWCTVSFVVGLLGAGSGTYLVLDGSSGAGSSAARASLHARFP